MRSCEQCGRDYDADSTAEKCADASCEGNILPPPKKSKVCLVCMDSGKVSVIDQPADKKAGTAVTYRSVNCPNPTCSKVKR